MEIYTIGFTKKTAAEFFSILRQAGIKRLVDIRLHKLSQLAGFTKRDDLKFFLQEVCGADYIHEPLLAPSPELFNAYKKDGCTWDEYERRFFDLVAERKIETQIDRNLFAVPAVLLCSEPTADHCHRRLILEYLQSKWGDIQPIHL